MYKVKVSVEPGKEWNNELEEPRYYILTGELPFPPIIGMWIEAEKDDEYGCVEITHFSWRIGEEPYFDVTANYGEFRIDFDSFEKAFRECGWQVEPWED